jgi:fumarate reductase subunit D
MLLLKIIVGALVVIAAGAAVFALIALLMLWLVGIAFPLLPFTYIQALALTGIGGVFAIMASSKS